MNSEEKFVTYLPAVSHVGHKWLIWRFGWFRYFGIILEKCKNTSQLIKLHGT